MRDECVTLYGAPHSLFTGRVRSYLIKAGIPYRETSPNSRHFQKTVVPKAGGRFSLPTIELADGTVIRDGAAIMDHFEKMHNHPFSPSTPKQNLISRLLDVIGAEGMSRPAMHYRWHFEVQQRAYLKYHFSMITPSGEKGAALTDALMERMRTWGTPLTGANLENSEVVESVYIDQLSALDRHLEEYGYLLGGRPCIGDFGMMIPLFGHLGRDPRALTLMMDKALRVYRWVERMNRQAADIGEYENQEETWLPDDQIPDTLVSFLAAMAEDFVPETMAAAECINQWLEQQAELPAGTHCERAVGLCNFELRGASISPAAQPYRFYLLKRVQDAYAELQDDVRTDVDTLLARCRMTPILGATINRGVDMQGNMEVWR